MSTPSTRLPSPPHVLLAALASLTLGCTSGTESAATNSTDPCIATASSSGSAVSARCTTGYRFSADGATEADEGPVAFSYAWSSSRGSDTLTATAALSEDSDHTVTVRMDDASQEVTLSVDGEAGVTLGADATPNVINVMSQIEGDDRRAYSVECPNLETRIEELANTGEASTSLDCRDLDNYLDNLDARELLFNEDNLPRTALGHVMGQAWPSIVERVGAPNEAAAIPVIFALATVFGFGFHSDNFDVCFGMLCPLAGGSSGSSGSSTGDDGSDAYHVGYNAYGR